MQLTQNLIISDFLCIQRSVYCVYCETHKMRMNNSNQRMKENSASDNFFTEYQRLQYLCSQIRQA